jgi:hypothetical protein
MKNKLAKKKTTSTGIFAPGHSVQGRNNHSTDEEATVDVGAQRDAWHAPTHLPPKSL